VITELPANVCPGQPAEVVDETTSAVITLLSTPILTLLILAVDWLDEPLAVVVEVDDPTVAIGDRFTPILASVIVPPAVGKSPVSATAVVRTGCPTTVFVTLAAVACPM
jgi:hypothetical protein